MAENEILVPLVVLFNQTSLTSNLILLHNSDTAVEDYLENRSISHLIYPSDDCVNLAG